VANARRAARPAAFQTTAAGRALRDGRKGRCHGDLQPSHGISRFGARLQEEGNRWERHMWPAEPFLVFSVK
jgi:hypothetical protein